MLTETPVNGAPLAGLGRFRRGSLEAYPVQVPSSRPKQYCKHFDNTEYVLDECYILSISIVDLISLIVLSRHNRIILADIIRVQPRGEIVMSARDGNVVETDD